MILSDKRRNLVGGFMTRWKEIKELTYSGIETKRKQSNSLKAVARRSAEIAQILANDVQHKPRTVGAASNLTHSLNSYSSLYKRFCASKLICERRLSPVVFINKCTRYYYAKNRISLYCLSRGCM